jgi:hypothetical protein
MIRLAKQEPDKEVIQIHQEGYNYPEIFGLYSDFNKKYDGASGPVFSEFMEFLSGKMTELLKPFLKDNGVGIVYTGLHSTRDVRNLLFVVNGERLPLHHTGKQGYFSIVHIEDSKYHSCFLSFGMHRGGFYINDATQPPRTLGEFVGWLQGSYIPLGEELTNRHFEKARAEALGEIRKGRYKLVDVLQKTDVPVPEKEDDLIQYPLSWQEITYGIRSSIVLEPLDRETIQVRGVLLEPDRVKELRNIGVILDVASQAKKWNLQYDSQSLNLHSRNGSYCLPLKDINSALGFIKDSYDKANSEQLDALSQLRRDVFTTQGMNATSRKLLRQNYDNQVSALLKSLS